MLDRMWRWISSFAKYAKETPAIEQAREVAETLASKNCATVVNAVGRDGAKSVAGLQPGASLEKECIDLFGRLSKWSLQA